MGTNLVSAKLRSGVVKGGDVSIRIAREANGQVSIMLSESSSTPAVISPVEARLLAIKLLLAAEQLGEAASLAPKAP